MVYDILIREHVEALRAPAVVPKPDSMIPPLGLAVNSETEPLTVLTHRDGSRSSYPGEQ